MIMYNNYGGKFNGKEINDNYGSLPKFVDGKKFQTLESINPRSTETG